MPTDDLWDAINRRNIAKIQRLMLEGDRREAGLLRTYAPVPEEDRPTKPWDERQADEAGSRTRGEI